jgi:hypothetical protein
MTELPTDCDFDFFPLPGIEAAKKWGGSTKVAGSEVLAFCATW